MSTIRINKILKFLSELDEVEFIYLGHLLDFREILKNLKVKYHLTNENLIERLGITPKEYNLYIHGAKNFDMEDMAKINALSVQLQMENIKEPIKIGE